MGIVRKRPSERANHVWEYLIPDGWGADEWRGGNCAALVNYTEVDGNRWEVCILPDEGLELPHVDRDYSIWMVVANCYDESRNGEWVLGVPSLANDGTGTIHSELVLPAYRLGEDFPTEKVLAWVRSEVRAGRTILV